VSWGNWMVGFQQCMKVLTVILMLHHDKQSLVDVPVSLPGLCSI
jgi:hypothetical protein